MKPEGSPTLPVDRRYWLHRHPRLALSAIALLGCVALGTVAEIAARTLRPDWAPTREERVKLWVYDALLGWAHTPNQRARFNHPDFSVEVVINSQGMRDTEYSVKRTTKRRMLVLGDSFAWGFGVEHHERFSELLEGSHADWEIINASVSGYGTDQEFLLLRERGLFLQPDAVLLLFCENDLGNNVHAEGYWHFKPYFTIEHGHLQLHNVPVPTPTIDQYLARFFLGSTYLGPRLSHSYYLAKRRLFGTPRADSNPGKEGERDDMTYRLISEMNMLCRKGGSLFVLVSVPMTTMKPSNLQALADREGFPYLPLDAPFASSTSSVSFPHDRHWNARGHRIAAKAIDAFLLKAGVFGASKLERQREEASPGVAQ